ncbi:hypothetical protein [Methanobrevibacter sp.]|uniref:hypothetical protein n=1 Tax=Methanobrevibacter sp. TaxID=66852 RepID=UPI00386E3D27
MSKLDGSWENDPLDLRCIRLDAEMDAGFFHSEPSEWEPQNLKDCYTEEFKSYVRCSSYPVERALKPRLHCFILDEDDNIVHRKCHDPYHAKQVILEKYDETYRILNSKTLEFISLEEAETYE